MKISDYLVVGSGCSGTIAAQTLVEKGLNVTMLDVGVKKDSNIIIPDRDFIDLRRNDSQQYKYFIGDNANGVNWGKVGKGEQITPPRKHLVQLVDKLIPINSSTFSPVESLGYGGLGIGWGLQCWEYTKSDLAAAGLDYTKMSKAYKYVASKIGVSATDDDAAKYTIGNLNGYQPSPKMDRNNQSVYDKYLLRRKKLNKKGVILGRTPLALLTKDKNERKKYDYKDMDFYSDNDKSAWRPWITVDKLKLKPNFNYIGGYLVLKFKEIKDYTEVHCLDIATNKPAVFYTRKLILASGALGSARIALRSSANKTTKIPILCNPYTYIPCVQPSIIGKEVEPNKLGFTQLSLFLDKKQSGNGSSVASLYSYQSLLLFRIIKQIPFNFVDARILMRYLSSGILIMGVHHPDVYNEHKFMQLVADKKSPTGDKLKVVYSLSSEEKKEYKSREKALMKAMRRMGAYPLKRIDPGAGASIHYAGTLPFSDEEKPYTLSKSGKLHGTKNIYVADSSGFNFLPAPGLAFSLMANAHVVAEYASSVD